MGAQFGVPLYGATLLAELVYDPQNADGCKPFAPFRGREGGLPVIVLARRGACFFVEKAFGAQEAGAKGVLIMDNVQEVWRAHS